MADARLEVTDAFGQRTVTLDKPTFTIGRRDSNDLRLAGSEVSRDHAEIAFVEGRVLFRDRGSRYGSFVNGEQVTESPLSHGDKIRLGRGGGAEIVFLKGDSDDTAEPNSHTTAIGDLRHVAALLEGLRALGSGRVLDDVLALVLDSALDVSGAERGFIMLATDERVLEFKLARTRGRITIPGRTFETSRKIPEEVFESGKARIVADLLDGDLANAHQGTVALGIRNVLCVPLRLVRYVDQAQADSEDRSIGVLYLDSREKGALTSTSMRAALETLATEAAVAIENARLYRETLEKAKLEQEMKIAAEIQRALLPKTSRIGPYFEAASATIPCRSIGGDFFDYLDLPANQFGFVLGDVAGKGPPAALLSALVQGVFAAQVAATDGPAAAVERVNAALVRRAIESRFVTAMYVQLSADGTLQACNAGHNPPFVVSATGEVRRLECGGPILGLFDGLPYEQESVQLAPGDWVIVFTDGVSEALSVSGEEFGDARIAEAVKVHLGGTPTQMLEAMISAVRAFTTGAPQNDDVTALVLRYLRA
jgi:serine phosphatase RsbU (regulator of sigma subunit)